jgi:molecular chaperone DnaJ
VLKIAGQGLPTVNRGSSRGNLYVRLGITVPKRTSDYEKELLLKLDEEAGTKRTRSKIGKKGSIFGKK